MRWVSVGELKKNVNVLQKSDIVAQLLDRCQAPYGSGLCEAFAPANIALCKYWGKRDEALHLPMTDSLSIALDHKGVRTRISCIDAKADSVVLNSQTLPSDSAFVQRLIAFLDLFRPQGVHFLVETESNIPVAAGLASSAAGFAALVKALNQLFAWHASEQTLSILARLGSGSACRSLWSGFVKWHRGERADGMDSFAEPLPYTWPDLHIGLLMVSESIKPIGSREAMRRTVESSCFYDAWPKKVAEDMVLLERAIADHDFVRLAETAESNALAMHATMLTARPAICYYMPETIAYMQKIWAVRRDGLSVYFTQDAGPNLKLLFLKADMARVKEVFPTMEIVAPFES